MGQRREGLFGEVERVGRALLEGVARVLVEVGELERGLAGKGMLRADKDVRCRFEKLREVQVGIFHDAREGSLVEVVEEEQANIAAEFLDVANDLAGTGLAEREVVGIGLAGVDDVDEGLHGEGVVLGGDGKARAPVVGRLVDEALAEQVGLLDDLARIAEQLGAFGREREAAVGAQEDAHAKFGLEVLDRHGERGLRHIEFVGRCVEGARLGDLDEIAQLLQCHGGPSFMCSDTRNV